MADVVTVEELAKRVEALERRLAGRDEPPPDWRRAVGMFADNELARQADEEGRRIRAASTDPELEAILREAAAGREPTPDAA